MTAPSYEKKLSKLNNAIAKPWWACKYSSFFREIEATIIEDKLENLLESTGNIRDAGIAITAVRTLAHLEKLSPTATMHASAVVYSWGASQDNEVVSNSAKKWFRKTADALLRKDPKDVFDKIFYLDTKAQINKDEVLHSYIGDQFDRLFASYLDIRADGLSELVRILPLNKLRKDQEVLGPSQMNRVKSNFLKHVDSCTKNDRRALFALPHLSYFYDKNDQMHKEIWDRFDKLVKEDFAAKPEEAFKNLFEIFLRMPDTPRALLASPTPRFISGYSKEPYMVGNRVLDYAEKHMNEDLLGSYAVVKWVTDEISPNSPLANRCNKFLHKDAGQS